MYKTLLLLAALAFVQARPNENAVVTNAKLHEVHEAVPARSSNVDDCDTLENGCPVDYTIHKVLPHENNCQLFYVCDKGEKVVLPCPEPLYFDAVTERCVWSSQTNCVNKDSDQPELDIEDETTPTTEGTKATTADDDEEPITAADDIGTTTVNGTFDIGEVLENGCPADIHIHHLLPHEECEKFYQCNFGEKVERDCAPGTVFHFEIQVCDWPRNVPRCAGSAGATARPPTTPGSEEAPVTNKPEDWEALPNGCPANSSIPHLLPHESECNKYYVCDNGRLTEMGCPTATHFSPTLQKCTWPHEAGCEHWTGGGCSNPGSTCGGTTATPTEEITNSTLPEAGTTADSNNSTTPTVVPEESTTLDYDTTTEQLTVVPENITTEAPTNSTTEAPTNSTTEAPTNSTTEAPTNSTTVAPTNATTAAPTNSTTEAPTNSTTEAPPNATTAAPTNSTTEAPTNSTTEAPTNATTAAPTNSTTEAPTNSTTEAPTNATTAAPTNSTTEAPTNSTTEPPTDSTTEVPTNSTTENITIETTEEFETTTTTTEGPICDTEGTTPDCPICPTVPVTPAEKCKQGCNVAPWAHEECDKYYSCIGDEFLLNICSEGLHFNPSTFTCDFICNAGCVRNVPQVTRYPDGVLMFVPNLVNSKMNLMELIEHELNGDL